MSKTVVTSANSAPVIGPYSPAVRVGNLLFLSGQIPLDPASGQLVEGDIRAQTTRVMQNMQALLVAGGADFSHVVRTTIFLADMNDFAAVNEVYARYFPDPKPVRTTVGSALLGIMVEIDVIAYVGD